ncbi:hypothetical protein MSAN_01049800 [Mycena sanguinolenta]|uniref:Cytochrome P450 n=1 Tax=Mycena sanguinolenta TaxID=230812 RepID=A0A8H6YRM5_9AGAR|nr:hypothetical protein MSAN_01049800 [Mycena sanguinolenta]
MDSLLVLAWAAALGLVNHFFFHRYEPSSANIPFLLLAVQPVALLTFIGGPATSFAQLCGCYVVFLGSLCLSITVYRLSPCHPLAHYPGPTLAKVTKLWDMWKVSQGYRYLYYKELHDKYGPHVRTGPNELSVIDAPAVCQILNSGGLEKGRYYEGSRHSAAPPSIVCMSGQAHVAKRRVWNRAMSPTCLREYEPLIVKRAKQLVSCLRGQDQPVDLVHWVDLFAFDLMGDLAFGGGFEMLREGRDADRVGDLIKGFLKASVLAGQLPWLISTLHLLPQVTREIMQFNKFAQDLAIRRVKNGSVSQMDLWYHVADEAGLEKEKPTLETSAADGIVAIVAASDTAASTLCSLVWFLLSNPEYYRRVQQELDSVIVDGDDPFDVNKHQELHFLSACINETLRLHPPVPTYISTNQGESSPEDSSLQERACTPQCTLYTAAPTTSRTPDLFLPDRWLPDAKFEKHDTSAFIPFSLGPANCVGQKFAKRELLMVLSVLFKSFEMRFADGFDAAAWPVGMQDFFVLTRGPLRVNLTPRCDIYV